MESRCIDPPLTVFMPDPVVVPIKAAESVLELLAFLGPPQTPEASQKRGQHLAALFEIFPLR